MPSLSLSLRLRRYPTCLVATVRELAAWNFRSRYLDGTIGPLPECEALYAERAPVGHVNAATCPGAFAAGP